MKTLHFNNSSKSQQPLRQFALQVLAQILENKAGEFHISVDDGDGDLYKYTVEVTSERVKSVTLPINEN